MLSSPTAVWAAAEPKVTLPCDLCGEQAHYEDDHVTYCECGAQACSSCIVMVYEGNSGEYVCRLCAEDHQAKQEKQHE